MFYRSGYKYQLAQEETFNTSVQTTRVVRTKFLNLAKGVLHIKAGYAWDGPSGPTYDSDNSIRGSLYHDAMYQLMRMKKIPTTNREIVDKDFEQILKADGMWNPRRWMWIKMVRRLAAGAADPKNAKKVHEAP